MSPRHFANLRQADPIAYRRGEDKVWNTFVSVTHTVGLSKFFSFTPDYQAKREYTAADGRFPDQPE